MKVVFFQRKPRGTNYSVEGLFQFIREAMPKEVECHVVIPKFVSSGLLRRIYNIFEAYFRQGDINHIAGDIHFLTYMLRKDRTLLTILDCGYTEDKKGISKYLMRLFWYVIPEKRVKIISVISQATKKELLKVINCDPSKIKVIHACISKKFLFVEKEFNSSKPVILQVGTGRQKNLLRLFEALEGISCRLEIVGKLTKEQMNSLSAFRIEYTNSSNLSESQMINKYNECDMVTFVSTYEGFGMPILEANAVGRPVITGNIYSMPEVAGDAACIVDPFDVTSIREGIIRIIKEVEYRTILINKGKKNIERFKPEYIAKCYQNIYTELLK